MPFYLWWFYFILFISSIYIKDDRQSFAEQIGRLPQLILLSTHTLIKCKDFKIFSLSEMGFTNFKIKPKFVEDLSQKLQVPLELVSG